ncbi:hypothetical protein PILCRDRAFT_819224 [Piloderma croceum F 1598]|uniref:Uncharacterized protein n=1 Tax=Piloderma croceum (strain F 1598) TaxID=765440 RepID=A0A0C3FH15_PILCF|nr:hypothetical protein PILCRDRAFT_819224 [Piloderma croceum F 1598]
MANRSKHIPRVRTVLRWIPVDPWPVFSSVQRDKRTTELYQDPVMVLVLLLYIQ